MLIKQMILLFFLASCSLFRPETSLKDMDKEKLLDAVVLIGEGRGRLSVGENQYVFSFDSLLKENDDWLLVVQIPLQGEEVLILPNLKLKKAPQETIQSLEERIQNDFKRTGLDKILSPEEFIHHLRALIRFNLGPKWGGNRNCEMQQNDFHCELDAQKFQIMASDKKIMIIKSIGDGKKLVLDAINLTETHFSKTDIRLYANEANFQNKKSSISLELFWKN